MHARPATAFAEIAAQFESDIRVQYGTRIANGKSMAAILKSALPAGRQSALASESRTPKPP